MSSSEDETGIQLDIVVIIIGKLLSTFTYRLKIKLELMRSTYLN